MTITAESTSESPTIIPLTQKHIDEGVRADSFNCSVAKAVGERTKAKFVSTSQHFIRWGNPDTKVFYEMLTPPNIQEWMDRYDSGLPVGPISFELKAA